MKLGKVLAEKKHKNIFKIHIDKTLKEAAQLMSEKDIGALLVIAKKDDPESYVGIITEKLFINNCWKYDDFLCKKIRELMTEDLVLAKCTDDVTYAMNAMTRHRARYIGVCENNKLLGLVSLGDIIKSMHTESEIKITYLREVCGTYGNKIF